MKIHLVLLWFMPFFAARGQLMMSTRVIAEFPAPTSFCAVPGGIFYVIESASSTVFKLDANGKILQRTGGFGWEPGLFDEPVSIYATSIRVFVADKNNNRIQEFDKELILTGVLDGSAKRSGGEFRYPLGCVFSETGDIFVLDSFNKKVIKYRAAGNSELEFGGVEQGAYALESPLKIRLFSGTSIGILEKERISVYDAFGTFLFTISPGTDANDFAVDKGTLYIARDSTVYTVPLNGDKGKENMLFRAEKRIAEIQVFDGKLFVLTEKELIEVPLREGY